MRQRYDISENAPFGLSPENPKEWRLEHFKKRTPHLIYTPSGKILPEERENNFPIYTALLVTLIVGLIWLL